MSAHDKKNWEALMASSRCFGYMRAFQSLLRSTLTVKWSFGRNVTPGSSTEASMITAFLGTS